MFKRRELSCTAHRVQRRPQGTIRCGLSRLFKKRARGLAAALLCATGASAAAQDCPLSEGVSVQILGSGGPIADDARASSSYLVWVDGRARAMVDVGGGAALRFGEAGASFRDLDAILLTHLHVDHSADLPSLLKSGVFSRRERSLVLAGPSGGGNERVVFPSVEDFVAALLQPDSGAYAYLGGYLDGTDGLPYLRLAMIELDDDDDDDDDGDDDADEDDRDEERGDAEAEDEENEDDSDEEEELEIDRIPLRDSPLTLEATGGSHGPVPAVMYAVSAGDKRVVFAGDHDGRGDHLEAFAEGADLLVLHMAIPEDAGRAAKALHAEPTRLGEIAAGAEAGTVVLSHFMARSLRDLDANVAAVKASFDGPVIAAEDLMCINLD